MSQEILTIFGSKSEPSASAAAWAAREELEDACDRGATWFFWIAGLSVVNSLIALSGSARAFCVGLGTTLIVDAAAAGLAKEVGQGVLAFAFVVNLLIAAIVALSGYLARQRHVWIFPVGMFLYALDAGVFILSGDLLFLAVHCFVLFRLGIGWMSCYRLAGAPPRTAPPDELLPMRDF